MKEFQWRKMKLEVFDFDNDKEVEFCITNNEDFSYCGTYLSPNEVNELICHLADCLKKIGEPIDILNTKNINNEKSNNSDRDARC